MRLFTAIELTPEIRESIRKLYPEVASPAMSMAKPEAIHITLRFIGEVREKKLGELESALAGVKLAPFTLKFKGVGVFPNLKFIRVIWVGCESEELNKLEHEIDNAVGKYCDKPSERFSGHVTIARPKGPVKLGDFFDKSKEREFGEMEVKSFVLKKSLLAPGGAVHSVVKEFKLGAE